MLDAKVGVERREAVGVVSDGQQTNVPRGGTVSPNGVPLDSDSESDWVMARAALWYKSVWRRNSRSVAAQVMGDGRWL